MKLAEIETPTNLRLPSTKEALILQLLQQHGVSYGLQMVERANGRLRRGTVYVTLDLMEDKRYLSSRQQDPLPGAIGLPRRLYSLTEYGRRVLGAWQARADAS
mgnify:CR=1 FL=1